MSNKDTLRMNGYSINERGHIICYREPHARYLHERCGVIRIALARDTREGRALVDRLLGVIDEPRSIVGRARNGGAVVLFRAGVSDVAPQASNGWPDSTPKALVCGDAQFVVTAASHGQTVDVDWFSWVKGRSPYEVERDRLAMLYSDTSEAVVAEAMRIATHAPTAADIDREAAREARYAKIRADLAAGRIGNPDADAAAEDAELVAKNPTLRSHDGVFGMLVDMARVRIARRKATAA